MSNLDPADQARRAGSFGSVASHYQRYRPGPPASAVAWIVPAQVGRVVDLGAGTGALSRRLLDVADEVVAVEPDDRMREVLIAELPSVRAVAGRGEAIPLPDGSVDAVLASSSWHWMEPNATLGEVGRVLAPGGVLAALWTGPDPEGPFIERARALLEPRAPVMLGDGLQPVMSLSIPPGVRFSQPENRVFTWDVALTADDLIGLLGTLSWIITMEEAEREGLLTEARRLLKDVLGLEGETTVDVAFRSDVYRSRFEP